jgi:hypothetical protein
MKTYKTWEVLKAVTENNKLTFAREDGQTVKVEKLDDGIYFVWEPGRKYLSPTDIWTLVQEPVPFMEAVKAYAEGKTIRCEIDDNIAKYYPTSKLGSLGYFLKTRLGYAVTTGEILNGKWYIEDEQ